MPSPSSTTGASSSTLAGVKPSSSAAEYRNGLKPEPGRRRAWVDAVVLVGEVVEAADQRGDAAVVADRARPARSAPRESGRAARCPAVWSPRRRRRRGATISPALFGAGPSASSPGPCAPRTGRPSRSARSRASSRRRARSCRRTETTIAGIRSPTERVFVDQLFELRRVGVRGESTWPTGPRQPWRRSYSMSPMRTRAVGRGLQAAVDGGVDLVARRSRRRRRTAGAPRGAPSRRRRAPRRRSSGACCARLHRLVVGGLAPSRRR